MYSNSMALSFRNLILILVSAFFLSGCLMNDEPEEEEPDNPDDGPQGHEVVGSVGDGPVTGSEVRLSSSDGGSLGTVDSDSSADFSIIVETVEADYPLFLEATGGTDLVTMTAPDFALRSAVLEPGSRSVANLNPFTTIAMELATDMQGGVTADNVVAAIDVVVDVLGSGLDSLAASGPLDTETDAGNIAEMIKASEALGEVIRRTRDALLTVGRNVSGNGVVDALGSDLTDGVIDGRGGPRADARIAAVANVVLAEVMLEAMPNELEVGGSDATDRMNAALDQVSADTPDPTIAELEVTASMLDAAQIGVLAGSALQPSGILDDLLAELEDLAAGMTPGQVASILTTDAAATIDNLVIVVAGASAADLELINGVVRTGELPSPTNRPPQIDGEPDTTVTAGMEYTFTPTASDPDQGDELTFMISGAPTWADDFDETTGTLTGTPAADDVGSTPDIVISVTDGQETVSLPPFTITVEEAPVVNTPPEIGGEPDESVTVGEFYEFTPDASDDDPGDELTFTIDGEPDWADFDPETGTLSGTPAEEDVGETGEITITVSDGEAEASLPAFTITVEEAPVVNTPPEIDGDPDTSVTAGEFYEFTPEASDDDPGDELTFTVDGEPSWADFDELTGTLSGTPGDDDVGESDAITITVSDGQAEASLPAFTITVEEAPQENTPPEITGDPDESVTVGEFYEFTPEASDDDPGDELMFTIDGEPNWTDFDPDDGTLSGTPAEEHVGVHGGITITVSDGEAEVSLAPFDITVNAIALGSATLSWTPPTQYTDGTALDDNLAGYRIYWGTSPGDYTESMTINNPGMTSVMIENLSPGTYEFVATAFDDQGAESDFSNTATKTISQP